MSLKKVAPESVINFADYDGALYAGTKEGLFEVAPDFKFTKITGTPPVLSAEALLATDQGLLVGAKDTFYSYAGGTLTNVPLDSGDVQAKAIYSNVAGTFVKFRFTKGIGANLLYRYADGKLKIDDDAIPSSEILAIFETGGQAYVLSLFNVPMFPPYNSWNLSSMSDGKQLLYESKPVMVGPAGDAYMVGSAKGLSVLRDGGLTPLGDHPVGWLEAVSDGEGGFVVATNSAVYSYKDGVATELKASGASVPASSIAAGQDVLITSGQGGLYKVTGSSLERIADTVAAPAGKQIVFKGTHYICVRLDMPNGPTTYKAYIYRDSVLTESRARLTTDFVYLAVPMLMPLGDSVLLWLPGGYEKTGSLFFWKGQDAQLQADPDAESLELIRPLNVNGTDYVLTNNRLLTLNNSGFVEVVGGMSGTVGDSVMSDGHLLIGTDDGLYQLESA